MSDYFQQLASIEANSTSNPVSTHTTGTTTTTSSSSSLTVRNLQVNTQINKTPLSDTLLTSVTPTTDSVK